jgi:hypothetical protein
MRLHAHKFVSKPKTASMKKIIIFILGVAFPFALNAQAWKTEIYRTDDTEASKTLRFKPEMHLKITTLLEKTDSTKSTMFYDGRFLGAAGDSIKIRVTETRMAKSFTSGVYEQRTFPKKYYDSIPGELDLMKVAVTDIDMLRYQKKGLEKISAAEDVLLFGSLALLILSPFICYNYKDGEFNSDLYQYFGLGCTAGIIVGFGLQAAGGEHELLFDQAFKSKKKKVWTFEK